MDWIKYKDERINLAMVAGYNPIEENIIEFTTIHEGELRVCHKLTFPSKSLRDSALKTIDANIKCYDFETSPSFNNLK